MAGAQIHIDRQVGLRSEVKCECRGKGRLGCRPLSLRERSARTSLRTRASETVTDQSVPEGTQMLYK